MSTLHDAPRLIVSSPYRTFFGLCAIAVLIWWKPLAATTTLALNDDAYTYILLVLPVSVSLLASEWRSNRWVTNPSAGLGCSCLAIAVLIGLGVRVLGGPTVLPGDLRLSLEMLAVVIWWAGSFICCFGKLSFYKSLFPWLFLIWLIPVPKAVMNGFVELLQNGTAAFARLLFVVANVPVAQDDTVLSIPGVTVRVAEECSSVRSSMMLLVSMTLMSYLFLRSYWGRTTVMMAAIPVAIAKNGFRVFTLALLGGYVDRGFLTGRLHHQGGILFFAVSMLGAVLVIWVARLIEYHILGSEGHVPKSLPAGNVG